MVYTLPFAEDCLKEDAATIRSHLSFICKCLAASQAAYCPFEVAVETYDEANADAKESTGFLEMVYRKSGQLMPKIEEGKLGQGAVAENEQPHCAPRQKVRKGKERSISQAAGF